MNRHTRLLLIVAGSIVGAAVLILVAVNLLISADWVRDRVANRIKEQTGRDLTVNGTTTLLFTPGPHVAITDAAFIDPEERAGTTDFSVARLVIDLTLSELLSRNVDAERIVLERPVLTVRLGDEEDRVQKKSKTVKVKTQKTRRDVKLRDVRVEDGTVNIVYGDSGKENRVERITANFSLPTLSEPFTGSGKFEWKEQMVDFSVDLATFADLRQKRPARLQFAIDTPALAARFDGSLSTRPDVTGQGVLSAKAHSIPSLLAWMREKPAAATGIGDGELASRVAWTKDEIAFNDIRFALEHASGRGQAVVGFSGAKPHIRAALALDYLDVNPFLSAAKTGAPAAAKDDPSERLAEAREDESNPATEAAIAPAPQPAAAPASFNADVNLNVRKARIFHLDLGPSSAGLAFRHGVLNATLGGMELYGGHARGTLAIDASRPVPTFAGDFTLDGVQAKPLLSDAAQFSLLEGQTKLAVQISGTGDNAGEIKSSLQGQGSVAVSDGAIEGVDLTEAIGSLGAGEIPELRQGPGAKTKFNDLGGSFTIRNGIAETDNLTVQSPLLKIDAAGTVNIPLSTIDMVATPEIVAGAEGQDGANDLAGLSVPVRIEGPLDRPAVTPQIKELLADPEKAGKAVKKIGKALQKKFKGKPVGEAIGRLLGGVQVESRDDEAKNNSRQAKPGSEAGPAEQADEAAPEPVDPDIERILR